jgi:hypothetical protein
MNFDCCFTVLFSELKSFLLTLALSASAAIVPQDGDLTPFGFSQISDELTSPSSDELSASVTTFVVPFVGFDDGELTFFESYFWKIELRVVRLLLLPSPPRSADILAISELLLVQLFSDSAGSLDVSTPR